MTTPQLLGPIGTALLGLFLLASTAGAAVLLISIFPDTTGAAAGAAAAGAAAVAAAADGVARDGSFGFGLTPDRGLLTIALLAGVLGSGMHSMQSFAAYVGDRKLGASWIWWYILRAPIGAILGLFVYVALRGGFLTIGSGTNINPYGVFAAAGLAGWFSKRATDKLAEVFDVLFRTAQPAEYTGKLEAAPKPAIDRVEPATLTAAEGGELTILGRGFIPGAIVALGEKPLEVSRKDASTLIAALPGGLLAAGAHPLIVTLPTQPTPTRSEPRDVTLT